MEETPKIKYTQKMPSLQRFCTGFEWVLTDWILRSQIAKSKGLKSGPFQLEGVNCTSELILDLRDQESHISIAFTNPGSIVAVSVTIYVNKLDPKIFTLCEVSKCHYLSITVPWAKKAEHTDVLEINPSKKKNADSLTIKVNLVIAVSAPVLLKQPPTNVLKKIKALFDNKKLCDFTLVLCDEEIPVHKTVLAAHSDVFEAMFSNAMIESKQGKVQIKDIDAKIFKEFLKYLYTGEVHLEQESVEQMIMVAEKYQVTELKNLCQNYMTKNLNTKNVVKYILMADKLRCTELKSQAVAVLKNNPSIFELFKEADTPVFLDVKRILNESLKN